MKTNKKKMATRHRPCGWLLVVACLMVLVVGLGCERPHTPSPIAQPTGKTCSVVIDFGDGQKRDFPKLAWREGITVVEAMQLAGAGEQGLEFTIWNDATGQAVFVDSIDGVKAEGGGAEAKNWTYKINGKKAQVSAGVQRLAADDVVVWKFGVFEVE